MHRAAWALLALLVSWGAARAEAAPKPRFGVVPFEGPRAPPTRAALVAALRRFGSLELVTALPPVQNRAGYEAVARTRRLTGVVGGRVAPAGKRLTLTALVFRSSDGVVVGRVTFTGTGRTLPAVVRRQAATRLAPLLRQALAPRRGAAGQEADAEEDAPEAPPAAPPAPPPPAAARPRPPAAPPAPALAEAPPARPPAAAPPPPVEAAPSLSEPAPEARSSGAGAVRRGPTALEIGLGLQVLSRRLTYENPGTLLPAYFLRWAPVAAGQAELYPLALVSRGALAHVGLVGAAEHTITASSRWTAGGARYATVAWRWSGGIKLRVPIGPVSLFGTGAYGVERFRLATAADGSTEPPIPGVAYRVLRGGGGLRVAFTEAAALTLAGGAMHLLGTGELGTAAYFPYARGRGLEASALLGLARGGGAWELRFAADFRQYVHELNTRPADLRLAARAIDRYLGVSIGVGARVGRGAR